MVKYLVADHSWHGLVLVAAAGMVTGVNLLVHMDFCSSLGGYFCVSETQCLHHCSRRNGLS
jgi:hypothetical protein